MRYFFTVGGPRPTDRIPLEQPALLWETLLVVVCPSSSSPMGAGVVGIDLCARVMGADCVA